MSQTPPPLPHFPSLSYPHHHPDKTALLDSKFGALLAFKTIALEIIRHSRCARCSRFPLRFSLLLFIPSLYFLASTSRVIIFHFLAVIFLSLVIVISLNIALPRFPSIRLLLSRKVALPICAPKSHPQVVWSIGAKPKSVKRPNSGFWVQVYSNGDVYEGEFYKGRCSGSGVYYYCMSGRYEGDWVDEKYDGHGVETWAKGSRYRGQYRQGLRHGFGVYRFYTGDMYSGEWCNGQCHGFGSRSCEDGSQYTGEFKWGIKHGLGHYHFRNGDTYAGEYFADKMHGFGVYRFGNGHRYEGAWHEGRRQGLGMYTFRNEETQMGHWQNGVLNVPSTKEPLPGSSFMVSDAKVHNVVQEAQGAAERALNVAKVDEKVNRAVAAANRAATAARVAAVKAVQNRMHQNDGNDELRIPLFDT
ncbi:hypothetical protein RJ640_012964 [Escallonia rubra]|uniref:Uncharacterized protein n=1 Tax=Escallonia rubra TaxID=112253 RepID=A0AA88U0T6_9ASTE|nr:hypothetical protein RJ640_012964 [Escallonia rubra]